MIPRKLLRGDKFVALYDLWNQLIDHLHENRPVAGPGIRLQRMPAGLTISATARGGGTSGGGGSPSSGGPFAVTIENVGSGDQPEFIVMLQNTASFSGIAGLVTIGSFREEVPDQQWTPKTGVVFCDITYDDESETYLVLFGLEETLPQTEDEKRYLERIAEISYDADTATWTAAQIRAVGDIEVLGRWVK